MRNGTLLILYSIYQYIFDINDTTRDRFLVSSIVTWCNWIVFYKEERVQIEGQHRRRDDEVMTKIVQLLEYIYTTDQFVV